MYEHEPDDREGSSEPLADLSNQITVDGLSAAIHQQKTPEHGASSLYLMKNACTFFGVTAEEVWENNTSIRFRRARGVTAYIMREKRKLPVRNVMYQLRRSEPAAKVAHRNTKKEISQNSQLATQVEYLAKEKLITLSLDDRIIMRVAEATDVAQSKIRDIEDEDAIDARQMAMAAMVECDYSSHEDIVVVFGFSPNSFHLAESARVTIQYQEKSNSKLAQQMDYVRRGIFSEIPSTFQCITTDTKDLRNNQGASSPVSLPGIDERLVSKELCLRIYDLIEEVAAFYKVDPVKLIGRTNEFVVNRARRAFTRRCQQARIPKKEAAICFGNRSEKELGSLAESARKDAEKHPVFAEELAMLVRGEPRKNVIAETLQEVARYYGVSIPEMREHTKDNWAAARARAVFLAVMVKHASATRKQFGAAIRRSPAATKSLIEDTQKRLKHDPRLLAEVNFLYNPVEVARPPTAEDILKSASRGCNISQDRLLQPLSVKEEQAKHMATYILVKETSWPRSTVTPIMQASKNAVKQFIKEVEEKVTDQPTYRLKLDCLRPLHATSFSSKGGKLLSYAFQRFGATLDDLDSETLTPKLEQMRDMTERLLQRANYTPEEEEARALAEILRMPQAA